MDDQPDQDADLPLELHLSRCACGFVVSGRSLDAIGRALYDHDTFAKAGIELGFLKPYEGSYESILPRLLTEDPAAIREEIIRETVIKP
jgi:hypothetical protein